MSRVFFQIGTNNGNDLFNLLVKKENPDLIILVEPNISLIKEIEKNYKDIKNVHLFNNAIYYEDNTDIELYIPAINGVYGNIGENNITYSNVHYSLVPMNDWGEKKNMNKIIVKSIRFDTICEKLNISKIEYLQIDTEGFDTEIIKMIDLSKYDIKKIRYEKWGFSNDKFTRHNDSDKSIHLGLSGMIEVEEKLKSHGYNLTDINDNDGVDIIAIKNNINC